MPQSNQKPFFENLDALRFFAFLTVFVSHSVLFLGFSGGNATYLWLKKYVLTSGDLGVSFFFVLSGFLITYLLLTEKESSPRADLGGINIKSFYIRRILRIWPVYFAVVILGFFVIPHIFSDFTHTLPFGISARMSDLKYYASFLANFRMASVGATSLVLAVLWSISVEEQFYLVWPWVVSFLPKKNLWRIFLFFSAVVAASFIYKFLHAYNYEVLKYSTFSAVSDLSIGATLAYFAFSSNKFKNWITKLPRFKIVFIYLETLAFICFRGYISLFLAHLSNPNWYALYMSAEPLIFSILFALIIAEQNWSENSFYKAKNFKLPSHLGRRSYGLYSYHMIAFLITAVIATSFGLSFPYSSPIIFITCIASAFILTASLAELSYKYMEKKVLRLKSRFQGE